jgi:hypothetical protein
MASRLLMAATIFVTPSFMTFAETDDQREQAPKPTVEQAQKLVASISGDPAKLKAYCDLSKIEDQMDNAVRERDEKVLSSLVAKMDKLQDDLGPEFKKVSDGLEGVEPNSAKGKKFSDASRPWTRSANKKSLLA